MVALLFAAALAPAGLSEYQHESLVAACRAGEPYGLCESVMAIVLAESSACVDLVGDDGTSFGCGQFQVSTAREFVPGITARQLVKNRELNLRLVALNLVKCRELVGDSWRRLIVCHNSPRDAVRMSDAEIAVHPYLMRVRERLWYIRQRYGAN